MRKLAINIVWIKRDLRTLDHEPLHAAESTNIRYLPVYIFDNDLIEYSDTSDRHLGFIYNSLIDINKKLSSFNKEVEILYGPSLDIFQHLLSQYKIKNIFSYQESGIKQSWQRDIKVRNFCNENSINWIEFQRDGIIRGIKERKNWNKNWHIQMHSQIIENSFKNESHNEISKRFSIHFFNLIAEIIKSLSISKKDLLNRIDILNINEIERQLKFLKQDLNII